jgi:hypothetical protein
MTRVWVWGKNNVRIAGDTNWMYLEVALLSRSKAIALFLITAAVVAVIALCLPRTPQPLSYHNFADQRAWLGIPNFGDVASNLAFAIVGIWGLIFLVRIRPQNHFIDARERWPYILVFIGMLLTAFGSSYYHLAPDNARLVWDRLPMTIVFMSMVAAIIMEKIGVPAGLWLWPLLLAIGAGSVLQWHLSEIHGHGDLRFYGAVQVYSAAVLLLALIPPAKYTRTTDFAVVAAFYVLAKILETTDKQIFAVGNIVSGHTLKHLAAAAAGYWILRMLQKRKPISHPNHPNLSS